MSWVVKCFLWFIPLALFVSVMLFVKRNTTVISFLPVTFQR
jgi:hypothetical protein